MAVLHSVAREALRFNVLLLRAQRRLSQAALAKSAGVSRNVISSIENGEGNVTLDVLERVAFALETELVWLFTCHVKPGSTDADILRRERDGPEVYVDADDFFAALDDRARYSSRGRRKAISTQAAS